MSSSRAPSDRPLRVGLVTREYPPAVYGGAGVHVDHLSRALAAIGVDVAVHCFGEPRESPLVAANYEPPAKFAGKAPHLGALRTLATDLEIADALGDVDVVHTHTWYANFAGHVAKLVYGVPHVMTSHSLEPLRPWKADQLGGGYALSCFAERVAIESADRVVAVSKGMQEDIARIYPSIDRGRTVVIHNGVDPAEHHPLERTTLLSSLGVDPAQPYVAFVGRITRQKGVTHLLDAMAYVAPNVQLVLCAGEPDTPEIGVEVRGKVDALRAARGGVFWIERMLGRDDVSEVLSHARAFVCPSIYEPFGIVNVEAMATATAVIASAVGGIPEIVVEGETGLLVPFEATGTTGAPGDPDRFARDLAARIDRLAADPALAHRMGQAGLARVLAHFTWTAIAAQTADMYRRLLAPT